MAKKQTSFAEKIQILVEISRPINVAMVVFGVFVTLLASLDKIPSLSLLLPTTLAAAFIAAGGNAVNDYYDVYIDRINRPNRPLPAGKITLRGIWAYAVVLFGLGILAAMFLGSIPVFLLAVINSILLAVYAYRLKKSGFFGDLIISYLVASVFIFAAIPAGNLKIGLILAVAAFFTNTAREVLKDLEDIKGDRLFGARTLPVIIGRKHAIIVARSSLIVSILVSPFPYTLGILSYPYLVVALLADGVFAYIVYMLGKSSDLKIIAKTQRLVKFGALFGLIALMAGAIPV